MQRSLHVLLAPLALAGAAATQALTGLGEPKVLAGDLAPGLAGGIQQFPAIAAGDGVHLAVWEDHRVQDEKSLQTGIGTFELWGRLIGADGTPQGDLPFRVAGAPGRKEDVRAEFHGDAWLVTWQNVVPTMFSQAAALQGVRVALDGTVLDEPPLALRSYQNSKHFVHALASDPLGWVVVVQGAHGSESAVESYRVSPGGSVTSGASGLFSASTAYTSCDLASNGPTLLFAVSAGGVVKGRRLSSDLSLVGGELFLAGGGAENVSVASNGTGFLVAWEYDWNGYTVQARTVSAAGGLGSTVAIPTVSIESCYDPSVVWTGADYAVAFTTRDVLWPVGYAFGTRVARLTASGALLSVPGTDLDQGSEPRDPVASSLGDGSVQLAWRDATTPPNPGDVLGTRLEPTGTVLPEVALSTSAPRQSDPDVAAGGEGYLAVFSSERGGAVSILAQRLDRFGAALDAEPFELDAGPALGLPRVAWNGSHFLVVWQDEGALGYPSWESDDVVLGRRVAADGTLLDAAPFHVIDGATPDVGAVGSTFLVAARRADTTEIFRIYGVRVNAAGTVIDGAPLFIGGNFGRFPSVDAFDDRWVVAWQRNPSHDHPSVSVFARVVLADGTMLDQTFVDAGPRPRVAASNDVALVTWGTGNVLGARLSDTGTLLGGSFPVGSAPDVQLEPAAAWDGSTFTVAWADGRNRTSTTDERLDVYANRVTESGALLDGPSGFAVAASPEDERTATVAGRDGDQLFAFGRILPEPPYATRRVAAVRASEWTSVGGGLAGASGIPLLAGDGALTAGGTIELEIADAAPSAPAGLVLGLAKLDLAFFGGVLVPAPDVIVFTTTDPTGRATTALSVPPGYPVGRQLWAQGWILDAGAIARLAGSNAITQVGQ
jgi:hypothetical protein